MENLLVLDRIESLRGRRGYEEKKAAKLGFASLYAYLEDKISKKQKAIEEEQKKIEDTKTEDQQIKSKKSCSCC